MVSNLYNETHIKKNQWTDYAYVTIEMSATYFVRNRLIICVVGNGAIQIVF